MCTFFLFLLLTPFFFFCLKAIPSSSPTHSGYVEWEAKRGKWCKRFIQLREHSLWISKRDTVSRSSLRPFLYSIILMIIICRDMSKCTFALYQISTRTESHGLIERPNLLLLPSNQQTICRFSKIQLITFIRLLVQRRMERFGWKKFLLLVYVPFVFLKKIYFLSSFELDLPFFCYSLMFFSKNDMFYSTRRLSMLAVMLLVFLVLGPEKRRFKDPITTFSNLVLFFRNNSRHAVSLSLSFLSFVHSFKPIMPFICIL